MQFGSFYTGVAKHFTAAQLASKFIVQIDENRSFVVLDNFDSFMSYKSTAKVEMFHEIILHDLPRKFFVDIDYKTDCHFSERKSDCHSSARKSDSWENKNKQFMDHVEHIKKVIIRTFNRRYTPRQIGMNDFLDVVSNMDVDKYLSGGYSNEKYKFSMNVIIDKYLFANFYEFASFGREVVANYNNTLNGSSSIIDEQFYSSSDRTFIQNRMLFSTKSGEERYKYPLINGKACTDKSLFDKYVLQRCFTVNGDVAEIIHGNYPTQSKGYTQSDIDVDDKVANMILDATKEHWKGFQYRNHSDGYIAFDKVEDVYCEFCNEIHHKDNFLYFTIDRYGNVFKKCHQNKNQRQYIWSIPISISATNTGINTINSIGSNTGTNTIDSIGSNTDTSTNIGGLDKSLYWSNILKSKGAKVNIVTEQTITQDAFTDDQLMLVKAEMKMGKSKALFKYLGDRPGTKVVFVSFRRTFSSEAKDKYSGIGFKSYSDSDVANKINTEQHRRIIVQVESLHRLVVPIVDLDFLVLDEVESIWSQFSSNNFSDFYGSFNVFEYLLGAAKKVIAMDANLSDRSARLFAQMFADRSINVYINKFNPNYDHTYYVIDKDTWLARLIDVIKDNNVAIFTNSLKEANTLKSFLAGYISKSSIKVYNSKTKESTKLQHFSNVNEYWRRYKCVICTPTVSAGVSFEMEHFSYVFGYFSDLSCNVETCRQMLGRVRSVGSKQLYITIVSSEKKYLTNIAEIKKSLANNREELVKDSKALSLVNYTLDRVTGDTLYDFDNFALQVIIENIAFDNRSRNRFYKRMLSQLSGKYNGLHIGCTIDSIKIDNCIKLGIKNIYNDVRSNVKSKAIDSIINANDLTNEQYDEMIERSRNMCDISKEEHDAKDKYKIVKMLKIDSATLTKDIVKQFSEKFYLRAFARNVQLFHGMSWEESIKDSHKFDLRIYDETNNRSKDTIMFNGVIHSHIKKICDAININVASVVTTGQYMDCLNVGMVREHIHKLIIDLLPMVDLPYTDNFAIGVGWDVAGEMEYCETIIDILSKFYKFRYRNEQLSYRLLGIKDVIYLHKDYYMNGKPYNGELNKPIININYE